MSSSLGRRRFFELCAAGTVTAPLVLGKRSSRPPQTYTYKTVQGCEIKADVHRPADDVVRPVMIWIHGGALIMGHRRGINSLLRYIYRKAGFIIVSIDYRLAPETKLPAIIEDIRDAYAWVREEGPGLFHADAGKIAVSGGSAGGYLTLMSGFCVEPRPKVLVSFWGYGDITSEWYSRPSPFYNRRPAVSKEEALKAVGDKVIAEPLSGNNRRLFYLYCRQQGLWPREVGGRDSNTDPKWFDRYCPLRNVSSEYPPTMLVHGQEDTDVPHEQSAMMAKELDRAGVNNELISIPNVGHGMSGGDPALIAEIYERAAVFAKRNI